MAAIGLLAVVAAPAAVLAAVRAAKPSPTGTASRPAGFAPPTAPSAQPAYRIAGLWQLTPGDSAFDLDEDGSFLLAGGPRPGRVISPSYVISSQGEKTELRPPPGYDRAHPRVRIGGGRIAGTSDRITWIGERSYTSTKPVATVWDTGSGGSSGGVGRRLDLPAPLSPDTCIVLGGFRDGTVVVKSYGGQGPEIYVCPPMGGAPQHIAAPAGSFWEKVTVAPGGAIVLTAQKTGHSYINGLGYSFLWTRGPGAAGLLRPLPGAGPAPEKIKVRNVNGQGQVVGTIAGKSGTYLWSNPGSAPMLLPRFAPEIVTAAWAISEDGTIVGHAYRQGKNGAKGKYSAIVFRSGSGVLHRVRISGGAPDGSDVTYVPTIALAVNQRGQLLAYGSEEGAGGSVQQALLFLTPATPAKR